MSSTVSRTTGRPSAPHHAGAAGGRGAGPARVVGAGVASGVGPGMVAGADTLAIAGLTRLSTCDWPGKLVATAFLQGCPWQCTYCQNPLLTDPTAPGAIPWRQVRDLLARRRGLLDGIVFSGGEPTRQPGLAAAATEARALGFGVGLHTAGAYPRLLALALGSLDWVGLDVKASPQRYGDVTGVAASGTRAWESLRLVRESGVDHEVRITVDPTVHTGAEIVELIGSLRDLGERRIVLQEARALGTRPGYAERLGRRRLRDVLPAIPAGVEVRAA